MTTAYMSNDPLSFLSREGLAALGRRPLADLSECTYLTTEQTLDATTRRIFRHQQQLKMAEDAEKDSPKPRGIERRKWPMK